jgi:hypothetical protein
MSKTSKRSFHEELVLNRWMLSFFRGGSLHVLKERLGEDRHEGIENDGQTGFFQQLQQNLFNPARIDEQTLRRYDLHIAGHWSAITEHRNKLEGAVLNMKYFQYLSLLLTEIYLDWYFNRRKQLLGELNDELDTWNALQNREYRFQPFCEEELNKLAFWNATGSGKTLLLHVNIRQYLHYFRDGEANRFPDKIILLTPNEGLSRQHLSELPLSGFGFCRMFDKNRSDVVKGTIEIIDINKLGDEMGEKKVAVEAFEGNNLVLVDEGHRGTGSVAGAWMSRREALVQGGFSFEYSATFGQAVAKGLTVQKVEEEMIKKKAKLLFDTASLKKLDASQREQLLLTGEEIRQARTMATREVYAKWVLFDYSYKFFYDDGYGKESLILNLRDADYADRSVARNYFTACLLSFYQQQFLWHTHRERLAVYNIEKPLWVFVGNTVSGEDSDILDVLKFLARFLNDDVRSKEWIGELIANSARLLDAKGCNIFHDRFTPLMNFTAEEVYAGILRLLFNTSSRQRLKVVNLKNSKGELLLRVGDAEPFGLINIGDDSGLFRQAKSLTAFDAGDDDFGGSKFGTLNDRNSRLHLLIGSRKFTEGWSSWRVSTMGLLNMGKGEGSQIIQLFGRGVRLKGKNHSLKRSTPGERPKGLHLERLETLNIFGVNAGYMAAFKEYLKEEGITPTDEIIELNFQTRQNLPERKLKTLALKDGCKDNQLNGFKRQHFPVLYEVPPEFDGKIRKVHIELDLYPRLEALSTRSSQSDMVEEKERHEGKLSAETMLFFNFDRIYLAVQNFKQSNGWSNLRLDLEKLVEFCHTRNDWYTLYIPPAELTIRAMSDICKHEDILIQLLEDYTERFYKSLKSAYEEQFYDVVNVGDDDNLFIRVYHFEIDGTDEGEEYARKIRELQAIVKDGKIGLASQWHAGRMVAICFDRHLFYPLFWIDGKVPLKMRPLAFDAPGEVRFVRDLVAFHTSEAGRKMLGNRSLYLLRNADTRSRGLGFALAGNFYPDFLLWIVDDETGRQWLNFIDPKGIRNLSLNHPKFGLYKEIKTIEQKLGDPDLVLNAFILSDTRFSDLLNPDCTQADLEARNILFMNDGWEKYLVSDRKPLFF